MTEDGGIGRKGSVARALAIILVLAFTIQALAPARTTADRGQSVSAASRESDRPARRHRDRRDGTAAEVVGGRPVPQGALSFVTLVLVDLGHGLYNQCGGSLIAPRYVLTAAHCVEDDGELWPVDAYRLAIGQANVHGFDPDAGYRVSAVFQHPEWNALTFQYDVAVLQLAEPVPASVAEPFPFVDAGETTYDSPGQPVAVAGWGKTSQHSQVTDRLLQADLRIASEAACSRAYRSDFASAVMICASFKGRDSCQGDSGGPLIAQEVNGFRIKKVKVGKHRKRTKSIPTYRPAEIMGIVSFGQGCAQKGYPGVYTRLSNPDINAFVTAVLTS